MNASTKAPAAATDPGVTASTSAEHTASYWLQIIWQAVQRLSPRHMVRQPVLFVVEIGAVFATVLTLLSPQTLGASGSAAAMSVSTAWQIIGWLWATLLFANLAEALAEGRGKARADSLKAGMQNLQARKVQDSDDTVGQSVNAALLRKGDLVRVMAGELIPADGEVIRGVAAVNEAAITGESAAVIRESGGDRSAVTGNTRVVSDWLVIRVSANPGESTLDRMIALVEGASRQKTPNELALSILLTGLTLIFLWVVLTLPAFASYSGGTLPMLALIALLVTLIPTTIGGLLSAIGIAGMDRMLRLNVVAKSGRAVEAAGDVQTLLLDKTGTITFGNRMADNLLPAQGVSQQQLARAALYASLGDDTPEGKSIRHYVQQHFTAVYGDVMQDSNDLNTIAFTAETRLSGAWRHPVLEERQEWQKGAVDAVLNLLAADSQGIAIKGQAMPALLRDQVDQISRTGGTPLLVTEGRQLLGAIHLKDVIKPGIRERFAQLRQLGIRTVMITGDNPLTAAAIAAEAGVDDYMAEATPERKLARIRQEQSEGRLVAMCGDGANDAPALAQADVGLAMNDGTQAAREAGNLVDMDSDPTKLLDVVRVGKQLLVTRGALTTFSIANDVAKYFAILPALFTGFYPQLASLNLMHLHSSDSAILSAIIFNALIIPALIPLALRGVNAEAQSAQQLLRRNLLIFGVGGLIVPFIGIKLIDLLLVALGWV
ncbi:K(+)-transporting ATPase subunit B [Pokkaliibacter plantistimulans]|uniref:Potassium-transporting ATPase ATP-binding subunit n=1 Tax=Proteobacteria bacterium 228 TaxID=2083153 RepID=A0A2S5KX13_9PROT|nr:potassium-transporting ATPase subunit KdpB [Pokkaliibacter plantistimulans]PPC79245.1 K(+)-transporting ATPase subunit B [Pokkaliibacter plantistimulans]